MKNRTVRMPRCVLLCGASLVGAALIAATPLMAAQSKAPRPVVQGTALDTTPESRNEAAQAIDAAVAAALIGAISAQFGERQVEVKLDRVATDPVNLIDSRLEGEGRLRIGDEQTWLPLRFTALYDSVATTVAQPRLTVGDDGEGEDVERSSRLGRALQAEADAALKREFTQQPAALHLDRIKRLPAGGRYWRFEGVGAATFDEGSSPVEVHALYDTQAKAWLRVVYELASNADRSAAEPTSKR